MATIWKYPLYPGTNCIKAPGLDEVLSVGFQGEQLWVWCLVEPDNAVREDYLLATITGATLPGGDVLGMFVGTAQSPTGIMAHVFEIAHGNG
jgi:hypothetical protein